LEPEHEGARELLRRSGAPRPLPPGTRAYHVRTFEIPRGIADTWFGEDDMHRKQSYVLVGDTALIEKLAELGIPLACLDFPRNNDYPL
jgi:hypothetical protein